MVEQATGWAQRVWRAFRIPVTLAVGASVWVAVRYSATDGRALDRVRLSLGQVIAIYLLGALVVGGVVLLSARWATSRLRGAVLGFVTGMALFCLYNFSISPFMLGGYRLAVIMAVVGLFPGAVVGAMYWRPSAEGTQT